MTRLPHQLIIIFASFALATEISSGNEQTFKNNIDQTTINIYDVPEIQIRGSAFLENLERGLPIGRMRRSKVAIEEIKAPGGIGGTAKAALENTEKRHLDFVQIREQILLGEKKKDNEAEGKSAAIDVEKKIDLESFLGCLEKVLPTYKSYLQAETSLERINRKVDLSNLSATKLSKLSEGVMPCSQHVSILEGLSLEDAEMAILATTFKRAGTANFNDILQVATIRWHKDSPMKESSYWNYAWQASVLTVLSGKELGTRLSQAILNT